MLRSLRQLFRKPSDPYAGVDPVLARRMATLFWIIGAVLTVALWPLSPPTDPGALGGSGWLLAVGDVVFGLAVAYAIRVSDRMAKFGTLLVAAFLGVAGISLMQWLAGGNGAPYDSLLLLPMLFIAAIYPPRTIALFFLAIGACLAAPPIYDGFSGNAAANAIAPFVLWLALGSAVFLLMTNIRARRLDLQRGEEQAREEARLDELTAISNRRAFEEAIVDEISRSDRMGTDLSMAMGDIEHFKAINDEFGHLEGDRCLHRVAQAMASELRTPDRVFRWGGDEFALLLPGTAKVDADVLIGRLQAKVSAACRRPDSEPVWIHFAAAELKPHMTATELSEAADLALMAERARTHRAR